MAALNSSCPEEVKSESEVDASMIKPLIRPLLLAFLSVAMVPAGGSGQVKGPQGEAREAAEAIARDLFLALQEARGEDATVLMHPDVLTAMRERSIRSARAHAEHRGPDIIWEPDDPDMPEAVAEWFDAKAREDAERYGSPFEQVYGVPSLEALEALSPHDFFARLLAASDPRAIIRRFTPEEDRALLEDRSVEAFLRPARSVIGSIVEGDSVVYVTYGVRHGPQASEYRRLAVLSLALTGDGWRAQPLVSDSELFDPLPFGGPISIRELHCAETQ
jgi:hypothetical protein